MNRFARGSAARTAAATTVRLGLLAGFCVAAGALIPGCSQTVLPDGRVVYGFGPGNPIQPATGRQTVPPPPAPVATGPTQAWRWRDGTNVVEAEITPVGADRYVGKIGLGAPGCGGGVDGPVTRRGDTYTLVNNDRDSGTMCRVVMTVRGRSMTMTESDCGNWHGASCAFDEHPPLTRVR